MGFTYNLCKTFIRGFFKVFCKARIIGLENLPETGGYILASNHVSYYDPFAVGCWIKPDINYIAKEELFENRLFNIIITTLKAFPVKRGEIDRSTLKKCLDVIKNNEVIGIFPEGTRSEDGEVHEAHSGAATLSILSGAPIVPAAVIGTQNALVRKLPPKWKRLIVNYGRPIRPEDFCGDKKEKKNKMSEELTGSIRQLKKELEEIWEP